MSIAPDEEAGLRAFAIRVGVDETSTSSAPCWIEIKGKQVRVQFILADWREEERVGFRVSLTDGSSWLLYYVPELDLWSGVADAGAVGGASSAPRWRQDGSS